MHADIKTIGGFSDGGGWSFNGRDPGPTGRHGGVSHLYNHSALDDRTRPHYSDIHHDETAETACAF